MAGRNRAGVKRRIRDIAAHVLADLEVNGQPARAAYTWDGSIPQHTTLFLGPAEGRNEVESLGRDPFTQDLFTIRANLMAYGFTGPDAAELAEEAAEAVLNDLDAALRASHRLKGIPGLEDGDTDSYRGIVTAAVGEVRGPYHGLPQAGVNGPIAAQALFDIDCVTDL